MKILLLLFVLSLYATTHAQTFIPPSQEPVLTEYHDGKLWAYLYKNDFVIGLTCSTEKDNYGNYYQIGIFIKNQLPHSVTFRPEEVYADLFSKSNDAFRLEVYTHEEYQKMIQRTQTWTMLALGISSGLNAGMAGHSTSYSTTYTPQGNAFMTTTYHYDANAAYQANMASTTQLLTIGQMMENDRIISQQGYLKTHTLHSQEAIIGYMNIKKRKGSILRVNIPINGNIYTFDWDISKKKKK